jgi:hypothetical protein
MRLNLLQALPLVLIACAAAYFAATGWPEPLVLSVEKPLPAEKPATIGEIDFDALHRQASAALEALRQSQKRQRKLAVIAKAY